MPVLRTIQACIDGADIVVLAVKPQMLESVVSPLARSLTGSSRSRLSFRSSAGVRSAAIIGWIGDRVTDSPRYA